MPVGEPALDVKRAARRAEREIGDGRGREHDAGGQPDRGKERQAGRAGERERDQPKNDESARRNPDRENA